MARAVIERVSPFFVVRDAPRTIAFYCERLGFETERAQSAPNAAPHFAILGRDDAMLFIKQGEAAPGRPPLL